MRDLFLFRTNPIPSPLRVFRRETTSHLTYLLSYLISQPQKGSGFYLNNGNHHFRDEEDGGVID